MGTGGHVSSPQFLLDQLILSQPGEQIMPTTLLFSPRFSDLLTALNTIDHAYQILGPSSGCSIHQYYCNFPSLYFFVFLDSIHIFLSYWISSGSQNFALVIRFYLKIWQISDVSILTAAGC